MYVCCIAVLLLLPCCIANDCRPIRWWRRRRLRQQSDMEWRLKMWSSVDWLTGQCGLAAWDCDWGMILGASCASHQVAYSPPKAILDENFLISIWFSRVRRRTISQRSSWPTWRSHHRQRTHYIPESAESVPLFLASVSSSTSTTSTSSSWASLGSTPAGSLVGVVAGDGPVALHFLVEERGISWQGIPCEEKTRKSRYFWVKIRPF